MKNRKLKNDIIILAAIIIIIILQVLLLKPKSTGNYAVVLINGKETARYSLYENLETDIITQYGVNHLVINNKEAYISGADCTTQVCVKSGAIKNAGESIVCLPHKLVIEIISE